MLAHISSEGAKHRQPTRVEGERKESWNEREAAGRSAGFVKSGYRRAICAPCMPGGGRRADAEGSSETDPDQAAECEEEIHIPPAVTDPDHSLSLHPAIQVSGARSMAGVTAR